MDILYAVEIADLLGGLAVRKNAYDEIVLTAEHMKRMESVPAGEGGTYAGIKIMSSPVVPDGYGILRNEGKVVGVLDFRTKQVLLLSTNGPSETRK